MKRVILLGSIGIACIGAIMYAVSYFSNQSTTNPVYQTSIGNYLFAGMIIQAVVLFLIQNYVESKRRVEDKKDSHTRDLVEKIFSKLTTIQAHVLRGTLVLRVERFDQWQQWHNEISPENLYTSIDKLEEPYYEFAKSHMKVYEELNIFWNKINHRVNETHFESNPDFGLVILRDQINSSHEMTKFRENMRKLVNDLNAGIPLKGKCRRGI